MSRAVTCDRPGRRRGLGFAPARHGGEGGADIGHLLHPFADAGEVGMASMPHGAWM